MSIYKQLKEAGVPLDSHESDLYALRTPESKEIVKEYQFRSIVQTFRNQIDNKIWYDIPFAYDLFWERRIGDGGPTDYHSK